MRSNIILHAVCAFLLVVAVSLTGCGKSDTVGKGDAGRVVTDTTGREVHLPSEIKSLAIVPIPWASVVYAVDGTGTRIAGMHPSAKAAMKYRCSNRWRRNWRTPRLILSDRIFPFTWRNSVN